MRFAWLGLLLCACIVPPEERETDRPAGSKCEQGSQCESLVCGAGTCTGGTCACPVFGGCDENGVPDEGCESGWLCVKSTIGQVVFQGSCKLACGSGCPTGWLCDEGFCAYFPTPPSVTARADKNVVSPGESVSFSAEASSENGAIISWFWAFQDGAMATEQNTSHAYDRTGHFDATVTVDDANHVQGSASVPIDVCVSEGTACPEQTGCCGALFCLQDVPDGTTFSCATCGIEGRPCNVAQAGDRACCEGLSCLPSAPNQTACLSCRPAGAPCTSFSQCCNGLSCKDAPGFDDTCQP